MRTFTFVVCAAATLAHGQFFEVVTDKDTVSLSLPGDNVVLVSVYLDRGGAVYAPWDRFHAWAGGGGYLAANGGVFQLPIETNAQVSPGAWFGRRPPSIRPSEGGSNGGFRLLDTQQAYTVTTGPQSIQQLSSYDTVLAERVPTRSFEFAQTHTVLDGVNQSAAERIEVFRAQLIFDSPGVHTVLFHPICAHMFDTPDFNTAVICPTGITSVSTSVAVDSQAPFVRGVSRNRDPVVHGKRVRITADDVIDAQSDVSHVRFFRDSNHNGRLDNNDQFLGRDGSGSNGWFFSALSDPTWGTAETKFFAQAVDTARNRSEVATATTQVIGVGVPYIQEVTVRPLGAMHEFRATGVVDTDGSVRKVRFFRDADTNGRFSGGDELIGVSRETSGAGFALIRGWDPSWTGEQTFFAQAVDDLGTKSLTRAVTTVQTVLPTVAFAPACPPDRNGDGWVGVTDFADYLNAYTARHASADLDHTPGIDQYDLVRYVELWDRGCD